jgi:hypothetical protein
MNGPKRLERGIKLDWKGLPRNNTNLLGPFISYKEKENFVNMTPVVQGPML